MRRAMNAWMALGSFLLGTGIGALLTAISFSAQIRNLKTQIREIQREVIVRHHDAA